MLLAFLLAPVGCNRRNAVSDEKKTYEVSTSINSLEIKVNAADFTIERGEEFSVESNLTYLSVKEEYGTLMIEDLAPSNSNYANAELTVYIPENTVFDYVNIFTGAAKLTVESLSTDSMTLKLGAGDVRFGDLTVTSDADIEGGAGEITINGGTINNLDLEVGFGELNLTAQLLGDNDFELGLGESNITLIGSKDDYTVEIDKAVGSITVDGKSVTDFAIGGSGENHIDIEGGVGSINLKFGN